MSKKGSEHMRKIGGVNMNTIARLFAKTTKEKTSKRYCSVYESLKESLKEVKLHKEGKMHLDTWDDFVEELKKDEE